MIKRQKSNPELATGEVEINAPTAYSKQRETPPFPIEDHVNAAEETRLRSAI